MVRLGVAFLLGYLPTFLYANPVSSAQASAMPTYKDPFSGAALMQLLVGLLVVIGLILFLSWALRRFSGLSPMDKNMRVLGVLPLSTREKAVLVQVGGKQLLLGVAPGRVSHLHTFDEEVVVPEPARMGFANKLTEAMRRQQESKGSE